MLFTFPSRYWFAIGLPGVFSLAGWSRLVRAGFLVSRVTQDAATAVRASHTGFSPSMIVLSRTFRSRSLSDIAVLQPRRCVATAPVWALPRSLATTGGIISLFSLPGGTKMFQFPPFASMPVHGWPSFRRPGCPIRKSPDHRSFAPSRSLSQLITSFVASESLGIRRAPFLTFLQCATGIASTVHALILSAVFL